MESKSDNDKISEESLTFDKITEILNPTEKNICEINLGDEKSCPGYFCFIPFPDKDNLFQTLILKNNQIKGYLSKNKKINVSIKNNGKKIEIILDDQRKIYSDGKNDITIIEIKKEDKIDTKDFITIEDNINKNNLIKYIFEKFYGENKEKEIDREEISKNCIKAEFKIEKADLKKEIRIINSFEQYKKEKKFKNTKDDCRFENEEEIKENCEITINGKLIPFSYFHSFKKKGKYTIEYTFKEKITRMSYLFCECTSLINMDFTNFNSKNVTNMGALFYKCSNLSKINFKNFSTENVTDMTCMFSYCTSLSNIDLSNFDTQKVTNMTCLFSNCSALSEIDLSELDTHNVTNMSYMFSGCEYLKKINFGKMNTQKVTNMGGMFSGCTDLENIDLSNLNTENVTDMTCLFSKCSSLTNIDLSKLNLENLINMSLVFSKCTKLKNVNLSKLNTHKVTNMSCLFIGCNSLTSIDLSDFDTANVENMSYMFSGCSALTKLNLDNFNTDSVSNMSCMFSGCTSLTKDNLITKNKKILKELNK